MFLAWATGMMVQKRLQGFRVEWVASVALSVAKPKSPQASGGFRGMWGSTLRDIGTVARSCHVACGLDLVKGRRIPKTAVKKLH